MAGWSTGLGASVIRVGQFILKVEGEEEDEDEGSRLTRKTRDKTKIFMNIINLLQLKL